MNKTSSLFFQTKSKSTTKLSTYKKVEKPKPKSFFKIAEKTVSGNSFNPLHLNALSDFMIKNEFYFDLEQWKQSRGVKTVRQPINPIKNSVIIPKNLFTEIFALKELDKYKFNLNFFDDLECFKKLLSFTSHKTTVRPKTSLDNVPK